MSVFLLKVIATVAMTLDHYALLVESAPVFFHWIGRISAPIFVFCLTEGIKHTKSKRKYCLRLYTASLIMCGIQFFLHIDLNFFRTLFVLSCTLAIVELYRKKIAKRYLIVFFIYQLITCIVCGVIIALCPVGMEDYFIYFLPTVLGSCFNMEGGLFFLILGLCFYLYSNKNMRMHLTYLGIALLYTICMSTYCVFSIIGKICLFIPSIGGVLYECVEYVFPVIFGMDLTTISSDLLYGSYQWMMVFALPFIFFYNGKRGREHKYFFYIFYPIHILVFFISTIML